MRYREEWRNDGKGLAFAQTALYRFRGGDSYLFQISSLAEQYQFASLLRENNSGSACSNTVHSGEEKMSDAVGVEEAN